ncbi:glycoside hydrolase domain-containing protein [Paenibacillus eucommiae]|uniref:SLH domain-containing protein n=1 Tax=Paenibacillus eucommiae TaxID=1355755 RepID=A0ABS4J0B4_9BACL|nr:glycoside hydrolase domain-containing protein [Paenibacillus eucommiae]MBP1992189.1 hypothetical protein [Paenibacillus eucommiae]
MMSKRITSRPVTLLVVFSLVISLFGGMGLPSAHASAAMIWTVDSLTKIFRGTVPPEHPSTNIHLLTARNEVRAAQIAIRSSAELTDVSVTAGPLMGPGGSIIDASNISAMFVDYIELPSHTDQLPPEKQVNAPDGSMYYPDRIGNEASLNVAANTTQPIWYSVYVPKTAGPGTYTGTVAVHSNEGDALVDVQLTVYDVVLTDPNKSAYKVDNWFSSAGWDPSTWMALEHEYGVTRWSDGWWTLMNNFALYMKQHRNNTIWVDPIAFLEPDTQIDDSGTYSFDWTKFDRFVQMFIDAEAMSRLHGVSIFNAKSNGRFQTQMLTKDNGVTKLAHAPAQSPEAEAWLDVYLPALKDHLAAKGWLDLFYQSGGDEPGNDTDRADDNWLYDKVHALAPGIRTIEANHIFSSAFDGKLDTYVVKQDVFDANKSYYKTRQSLGDEVWLYICNLPTGNYLVRNIDAPLADLILPHIYTFKNGLTGYLHWGFNYWNAPDVLHTADTPYPGDSWLVYPDKSNLDLFSSIRSEIQLEGIQDHELLQMLAVVKPDAAKQIADSLVNSGSSYNVDANSILLARKAILDLLTNQAVNVTDTDDASSFDGIYSQTEQWALETANPNTSGGDLHRIVRKENTDQSLVYYRPNIRKFAAKLYSDSTDEIEFYASADNKKWTPIPIRIGEQVETDWGWHGITVTSGKIPWGTYYLKVVIKGSNANSWSPQLGELAITYGYEVSEPESLIDNNGFEAGLWPISKGAEIDTSVKHMGKQSAKITAGSEGSGEHALVSEPAAIDKKKKHSFSIWLKTDQISTPDGVNVQLMQLDAQGNELGLYNEAGRPLITGGTQDWTEYTIDNIRTSAAALQVIVTTKPGVTGTVWVDDVVLLDQTLLETFIDTLDDFDSIAEHSGNFLLATTNPNTTGGDGSRLMRGDNTESYIVYNKPNIRSFSANIYSDSTDLLDFLVSPDNLTWTPLPVTSSVRTDTDWGWFKVTKSAADIPQGTQYLKIVFKASNANHWSPQLGDISIAYGFEASEPDSLVPNSGFESGLWETGQGAELDTAIKHMGAQSAKMVADGGPRFIASPIAPIGRNKKHSLSLWLKTDHISTVDGVQVELMQLDTKGNDIGLYEAAGSRLQTGGTQNWTEYRIDNIASLAASLRVIVRTAAGASGTVWVDDVVIADSEFAASFTDTLDSLEHVFSKSESLGIESANPIVAGGDAGRLSRTQNTDQYVVYYGFNMRSFKAQFYSDSTDNVDFYTSHDNQHWEPLTEYDSVKEDTDWGWYRATKSADNLPWGIHYLKIVIRGDNETHWSPQLGEIKIEAGYGDVQPPQSVNLLQNSGFELGLWPKQQGAAADSAVKHSGDYSARLTAGTEEAFIGSDKAVIDAEKSYTLSLWLKTAGLSQTEGVKVDIIQVDELGHDLGLLNTGIVSGTGGTNDWTKFSVNNLDQFHENTAALRILVRTAADSTGTLWVDDVALLESPHVASNNADLKVLSLSHGSQAYVLTPVFPNASDNKYTLQVENAVTSLDISAVTKHGKAKIAINSGEKTVAEASQTVDLVVGTNTVTLDVTAEDNVQHKSYTVQVIRAEPQTPVSPQPTPQTSPSPGDHVTQPDNPAPNPNLTSKVVIWNKGGTVSLNKAKVEIPANALTQNTKVTIEKWNNTASLPKNENRILVSDVVVFTKEVAGEFKKTVSIYLPYTLGHIDLEHYDLVLAGLNESTGKWVPLNHIQVDQKSGLVSGETTQFAKFAIWAEPKAQAPFVQPADIAGHFAEAAILQLISEGVINGYSDGTFKPEKPVTRAEFTKLLAKALKLSDKDVSSSVAFADQAEIPDWAQESVALAVQAGFITGYEDGSFRPNAQITRAEIVAMIVRASGLPLVTDTATSFSDDGRIPAWAKAFVVTAVKHDIVHGRDGNRFAANETASRAEAAVLLTNLLQK